MASKPPYRYLFVGPLLNQDGANVGGATVSFTDLIEFFKSKGQESSVVDTQKHGGLFGFLYVLATTLYRVLGAHILFLNLSQRGIKYLAPILFCVGRIFRKQVVIRPFGGWIIDQYQSYSSFHKWMFKKTIAGSDIFYFQTEAAIDFFDFVDTPRQLPTSRRKTIVQPTSYRKKFVFLGHVKASKGINEIIEAKNLLDSSFQIDIYGPIIDDEFQSLTNENYYEGQVEREEITDVLNEYDVLIFPSYYEGEGYPGVIIEAYSIGMPVIATRWMSIPEIVQDDETGYLIEPQNSEELIEAIERFEPENYERIKSNVQKVFNQKFDRETVLSRVMQECESILTSEG